ncbi:uncharacterized protein [Musca autumnalis]|uniref:uncharacterized protein n=1 Tax=Musca autumnalis TaxID=221902 RepID=UPI003CF1B173
MERKSTRPRKVSSTPQRPQPYAPPFEARPRILSNRVIRLGNGPSAGTGNSLQSSQQAPSSQRQVAMASQESSTTEPSPQRQVAMESPESPPPSLQQQRSLESSAPGPSSQRQVDIESPESPPPPPSLQRNGTMGRQKAQEGGALAPLDEGARTSGQPPANFRDTNRRPPTLDQQRGMPPPNNNWAARQPAVANWRPAAAAFLHAPSREQEMARWLSSLRILRPRGRRHQTVMHFPNRPPVKVTFLISGRARLQCGGVSVLVPLLHRNDPRNRPGRNS